jgi:hypothetical protein
MFVWCKLPDDYLNKIEAFCSLSGLYVQVYVLILVHFLELSIKKNRKLVSWKENGTSSTTTFNSYHIVTFSVKETCYHTISLQIIIQKCAEQSALNMCTVQPFTDSDDTRCCVNAIFPPEDGHVNARNMSRIIV